MPVRPLAEVFGHDPADQSDVAKSHRKNKLCPFNNKVPNCTKNSVINPLWVCSIYEDGDATITCPVRFRQDWVIASDAAAFFFPNGTKWTSLTEVRLNDADGQSAGNIDVVLVSYDDNGTITDFGSLEVQAVYISGNVTKPFEYYMADPQNRGMFTWPDKSIPRPDYLSSSRKRLVPQVMFKGGILKKWDKKQAVALQESFYNTLPPLPETTKDKADIAWFLYNLHQDPQTLRFTLTLSRVVYTAFEDALLQITTPKPGEVDGLLQVLQRKLDEKLGEVPPEAPTLQDILVQEP